MEPEKVAELVERLRGAFVANDALMNALLRAVPRNVIEQLEAGYNEEIGIARAGLQSWATELVKESFEIQARESSSKLDRLIQDREEP